MVVGAMGAMSFAFAMVGRGTDTAAAGLVMLGSNRTTAWSVLVAFENSVIDPVEILNVLPEFL